MTNFAWLIEAPGPHYLSIRDIEFVWTTTAMNAIRFFSEDQADSVMMALRNLHRDLFTFDTVLAPARAVEHGFMENTP